MVTNSFFGNFDPFFLKESITVWYWKYEFARQIGNIENIYQLKKRKYTTVKEYFHNMKMFDS